MFFYSCTKYSAGNHYQKGVWCYEERFNESDNLKHSYRYRYRCGGYNVASAAEDLTSVVDVADNIYRGQSTYVNALGNTIHSYATPDSYFQNDQIVYDNETYAKYKQADGSVNFGNVSLTATGAFKGAYEFRGIQAGVNWTSYDIHANEIGNVVNIQHYTAVLDNVTNGGFNGDVYVLSAEKNGVINISNGLDISANTTLPGAKYVPFVAIRTTDNGVVNVNGDVNIKSTSVSGGLNYGLYVQGNSKVSLQNGDIVMDLQGATGRNEAVNSAGTVEFNTGENPENYVVQITGSIRGNGIKGVFANEDSYYYGVSNYHYSYAGTDLTFKNGAEWVPTACGTGINDEGASALHKNYAGYYADPIKNAKAKLITLEDGGVVNLSKDNYKTQHGIDEYVYYSKSDVVKLERTEATNRTVEIDSLNGNGGVFKLDLNANINTDSTVNSDMIYIKDGEGTHKIAFDEAAANLQTITDNPDTWLRFATVGQDGAEKVAFEKATYVTSNALFDNYVIVDSSLHKIGEEGKEKNDLYAGDKKFYDGKTEVTQDDIYGEGSVDWYLRAFKKEVNENGKVPVKSYNAAFALWRDDDTLLKRLGEVRFSDDEGGVWARAIGKKLEDDRSMGFNTHAKTIQVGYDRKDVQKDGSGTWRKGIAIGHTWADTSFGGGDGTNNYTDLSLYATNIRKHDHYWDFVVRVGRIDSEYDTVYGDHGEFDNWASSVSAEYGRKKKLNEDNWFIEPQAQLTYSYVWGDSYTTNKGIRVEQDNADSLVGRAGFIISKELESERKYPHRYYAKAFVMHEFLDGGDNNLYLGSDRFYSGADFKDTWYVVGIGANVDMGNNCDFYLDAEKNFKASVEMPYRIEAGFRWEF